MKQRVREKLLIDCNLHTIIRLPNSVFAPYATVATNLLFFEKKYGNADEKKIPATHDIWYYEHRLPDTQKAYSKTRPIQRREFDAIEHWWHNRTESEQAWRVPYATIVERGFDLDIKNPNRKEEEQEHSSQELIEMLATSMEKSKNILEVLRTAIS